MKIIRFLAIDPSVAHCGTALGQYIYGLNPILSDTNPITFQDIKLLDTEKQTTKQIRQNSDDLRRAKEMISFLREQEVGVDVIIAEIPTGSQNSRAAFCFGMVTAAIACLSKPIIQVQPSERGIASIGRKSVSKEEIIQWATTKYPDLPWLRFKDKSDGRLLASNEHLADACAIAHAGIKTDQFQTALSMFR